MCALNLSKYVLAVDRSSSSNLRSVIPSIIIILFRSIKPLVQCVRESPNIKSIMVKSTGHLISLFADDISLFFSNTRQSLDSIMDVSDQFSHISSYKIDWTKLSILL